MKKTNFLFLLLALCSLGIAQPKISRLSFPDSVNLFGLYEVSFNLGSYSNPYDPEMINVFAEFVAPSGKSFIVNGFYYEEYTFSQRDGYEVAQACRDNNGWRIRFTPDQEGTWSFSLHAIDRNGTSRLSEIEGKRFVFNCKPTSYANGFISIANSRFLKRDLVENGQRKNGAFFPCGPNVAWYEYIDSKRYPKGIYDYEQYIDTLTGNANYIRIWLNRYQYLSLYGPEYTQMVDKKPTVYFDSTLNQKDAAELDHIVEYAAQHGITLMPCVFTFGDFFNEHQSSSKWDNNPFKTVLELDSSAKFFTDSKARRIAKNLLRYIVARWGYATNIVAWELWNEVDNIPSGPLTTEQFHRNIVSWHEEMARYIRTIDPFGHPITTSITKFVASKYLCSNIFSSLDVIQLHTYGNIQKAKSKEQRSHQLYEKTLDAIKVYPDKPIFIGEFGFGQSTGLKYQDKDPFGFDTHNCLWSSMFSSAMGPASFWYWNYLREKGLFHLFGPVLTFSKNLPVLSETFSALSTASIEKNATVFPNGIETYYLISAAEDTLYGWCQDSAFSYQALRRLTDRVGKNGHFDNDGVFDDSGYVYTLNPDKKPKPCSRNNTITLPIKGQPVGAEYVVRWYDSETGLEIVGERAKAVVKKDGWRSKAVSFEFPSSVRDLKQRRINNTYGDAVFSLILDDGTKTGSTTQGDAPDNKLKINVIHLKQGETNQ